MTTASELLDRLRSAILDLDMDAAVASVQRIAKDGEAPAARAGVDAVSEALQVVGRRFQEGEWFVGELVYAGEIAKASMDVLSPLLAAGEQGRSGRIVVGTVAGDLHDLGKNIFVGYARGAGFAVVDLGVDVATERFIAAVNEHRPIALGLSCLLTVTAGEVAAVIRGLERRGTRQKVKVIVGGAALTERFAHDVGADAFAPDAVTGTDIIKGWGATT